MLNGRDPREALLLACQAADSVFEEGRQRLIGGEQFSVDEMDRFLGHVQRVAALAKVAIDARLVDVVTRELPASTAQLAVDAVVAAVDGMFRELKTIDPVHARAVRAWALQVAACTMRHEPPPPAPPIETRVLDSARRSRWRSASRPTPSVLPP